jgi:tetratricopeptide (TPR) repeat protein
MKRQLITIVLICLSAGFVFSQDNFNDLQEKGNKEVEAQNYAKALEYFDAALKAGNEDKNALAWTASIAAMCAQQMNQYQKAIEYNDIAINNKTIDITVYETQIELTKKTKNIQKQEEAILAARELDGQYKKFTTKLLYFYYNKKMYEKLLPVADDVLKYKPGHIKTYYFKGIAYSNTKNKEEAINSFKYILEKDSMDSKANKQLGLLYYNKASGIYEKAKKKYNAFKKPTRVDYTAYRKSVQKSFKPYKQAIPYLEKAYAAKPDDGLKKALFNLYSRLEQKSKAAEYK